MLRAQLHSFDHSPFSAVSLHICIAGSYFFSKNADNTMQRGDFATKICKIATKFSYLVANCDWIFLLISSPALNVHTKMMYSCAYINLIALLMFMQTTCGCYNLVKNGEIHC